MAELADFYSTLNIILPSFREGNSRTQRIFFAQWLRSLGYNIDFYRVYPDEFMIATIGATQGVMNHLTELFENLLTPAK